MWLLHTEILKLSNFLSDTPDYVILSHTWGKDEVAFEEMDQPQVKDKLGYRKVAECCVQARKDGYDWAWIDTCCIDKRSSAELSEAINSMYDWYWNAALCYVYLADCQVIDDFEESRWFKRGWTLQELLAPNVVEFYNQNWQFLGSKERLAHQVATRTNIAVRYLRDRNLIHSACLATKFHWASRRQTSRKEDKAYCLLGLVQVNMPMLYGEGSKAFYRLQLELLRKTNDHTMFMWQFHGGGLLAPSPAYFEDAAGFQILEHSRAMEALTHDVTNFGLRITLPCIPFFEPGDLLARFHCRYHDNDEVFVWLEGAKNGHIYRPKELFNYSDALSRRSVDPVDLDSMSLKTIYLSIEEPRYVSSDKRKYSMKVRAFHPNIGYIVNGISVSTMLGVKHLKKSYDGTNSANWYLGREQSAFLMKELTIQEKEAACVRLVSENDRTTSSRTVIFGLRKGRPVLGFKDGAQGTLAENWYLKIRNDSVEWAPTDHIRMKNDQHIVEVRARKIRQEKNHVWALTLEAFPCVCRFSSATEPGSDCFCGELPLETCICDACRPWAWESRGPTPEPDWEDVHLMECTCFVCERESKIVLDSTHLVECNCKGCRKDGKIEMQPLYCEDNTCTTCNDCREVTDAKLARQLQDAEEESQRDRMLLQEWTNKLGTDGASILRKRLQDFSKGPEIEASDHIRTVFWKVSRIFNDPKANS